MKYDGGDWAAGCDAHGPAVYFSNRPSRELSVGVLV